MLKRFLLMGLLTGMVAAAPPTAFEKECRRLEPLLETYDPSCPGLLARLREQAAQLSAGPDRAHFYWLSALYAGASEDETSRDRFQRLALEEPGVAPLTRALWLHRIDAGKHVWVQQQLAELAEEHPKPLIFWCSQMAQASAASAGEQTALARTLWLSALTLAEKEGWADRQVEVWLRMQRFLEDKDRCWEGAFRVAARSRHSELLWQVLRASRTQAQWDRTVAAFTVAPEAWELKRGYAEVFGKDEPRDTVLNAEQRADLWSQLALHDHKTGQFEKEIESRLSLGLNLLRARHIRQGLRQLEAAVQIRLDHPPVTPEWVAGRRRLGRLARTLTEKQAWMGYSQQSLASADRALEQGWTQNFVDQWAIGTGAMKAARELGDEERLSRYWKANWETGKLFPAYARGEALSTLLRNIPPDQGREAVLRGICDWAEDFLKNNPTSKMRWTALSHWSSALREQGQKEAVLRLWLNEFARGDRATREMCSGQIVNSYRELGRASELKEFVLARLADGQCSSEERADLLVAGSQHLYPDPQALALADQLVHLREQKVPNSQEHLFALEIQAFTLNRFGRYEAAFRALDQARLMAQSHKGLDRWLPQIQERRAQVLWASGRREEAVETLRQLVQKDFDSERPELLSSLWSLASYEEQSGHDWQAVYESALNRASRLDESGQSLIPQIQSRWLLRLGRLGEWEEGRKVLTRHPWKGSGLDEYTVQLQAFSQWSDLLPARAGAKVAQVADKQPELAAVVDELRLSRPDLGQLLSLRSTNLRHLQARLGAHDTLVTYCQAGQDLYVFVLRRDSSFYWRTEVPTLASDVSAYLGALNTETRGQAEGSLFSLLLQPVLTEDPEQRLFLVPTGSLWQVPFGALRDANHRSAAAQAELVLMGSGDLLRMADKSWEPYQLTQPLAIGAPPAADLPGAFAELEEVSKVLPGCRLLRGAEAVSTALYEPQQHWGLLHFASHAHYRRDRPTESDIQLHDGPLQLKQLPQLSLAEHSLVALSCCQGGASAGQGLDEPVTLATGFSAAGAETVVANLWRVDDEVARVFFGEFYRELAAGSSPGKSFRTAQAQTRQRFPKTSDWAGFFLLGNPT